MALLNEAVAANAAGHIADHDLIAHVVNETFAVVAASPAAGGTYAPDVAAGTTHALTLPSGGAAVTIGATTSSAAGAMPKYLPGQELTVALLQQASPCAGVAWHASYVNPPPVAPVPGQTTVVRFVNIGTAVAPTWLCTSRGGPIPCTSVTRPTVALVVGSTMIFETDTGDLKVWTAAGWRTIPVTDALGLTLDALGGAVSLVGTDVTIAPNGGPAQSVPRGSLEVFGVSATATPTTLNSAVNVATSSLHDVQNGHRLKLTMQVFDFLTGGAAQSVLERWTIGVTQAGGTAAGTFEQPTSGATFWTSSNMVGGAQPGTVTFLWKCTAAGTVSFNVTLVHNSGTAGTTGHFNTGSVLLEHSGNV